MQFGAVLKNVRLNIWGPKTLGLIFRGQQRKAAWSPVLNFKKNPPPGHLAGRDKALWTSIVTELDNWSLKVTPNLSI